MGIAEWALLAVCCLIAIRLVSSAVNSWRASKAARSLPGANWSGRWHSTVVPLVAGRLFATLPTPLPKDQPFDVEVVIYYKLWCLYRPGQAVRAKFTGQCRVGETAGGSNADAAIPVPFRLTIKSVPGVPGMGTRQVIEYVATGDDTSFVIVGGYRSAFPMDFGCFSLCVARA